MIPQQLFRGLVETLLDCKDTIMNDGIICSDIPEKTVTIVNKLLKWKRRCEDEKKFEFPDMSSEDRKYTSCDWLINGVKCFAHAAYRGEFNLLKWIRYDVKDQEFFVHNCFSDDYFTNSISIIGLSENAIPVIKWLQEEESDLFYGIKKLFLRDQLALYEIASIFTSDEENDERSDDEKDDEENDKENGIKKIRVWPTSVERFILIGNADQVMKFFSNSTIQPYTMYGYLEHCTDEVYDIIMKKFPHTELTYDRCYPLDLKRTVSLYEKYSDKISSAVARAIAIVDFNEEYLIRLFDLTWNKKFFESLILTHNYITITKCLIKHRLEKLKLLFQDFSFEEFYGYVKGGDHRFLNSEAMVMIYEAINQ